MNKIIKFADFLKNISAEFLMAILAVLGLLLFLPSEIAAKISIYSFRETYRTYLGPAFLLVAAFLIARFYRFIAQAFTNRKNIKIRENFLRQLTPEEKGYLFPYIQEKRNTVNVGPDDGIMGGLVAKHITYRASNIGGALEGMPYNLQPWAREYLTKNSYLLDGHIGSPKTPEQKMNEQWEDFSY